LGKDEASNNLPLNGFQEGIIRCLDRDGSHGMQCARSAVRHLMKAWNLRDLDLGMALFRCLTAEEEAATAVFLALKSRQYEGASRLNHRSHRDKTAVIPFFRAVSANFAKVVTAQMDPKIVLDERGPSPRLRVRITHTPPVYPPKWAYPEPPLHFSLRINDRLHDFRDEMQELARSVGVENVITHIDEQKNLRNRVLYASPQGVPEIEGNGEALVLRRRDSVFGALIVFLLIEQTSERQLFAQQCLNSFLKMLGKLPMAEVE
jgi:hypothetical protein